MAPVGSGRASISVTSGVWGRLDSQRALAAPHPPHPPPMITYFFWAGVVSLMDSASSDLVDWIEDVVVCNRLVTETG